MLEIINTVLRNKYEIQSIINLNGILIIYKLINGIVM